MAAERDRQSLSSQVHQLVVGNNDVLDDSHQPWTNTRHTGIITPDPSSDSGREVSILTSSSSGLETEQIGFIIENERRYCNDTYFMPNDEPEQARLTIVHQIYLTLLDGQLTTVPLASQMPHVLDIGTGPSDWAIEMGRTYPNATIVASDIGVFDQSLGHVDLPNLYFQLDDARDEWAYRDPFDDSYFRLYRSTLRAAADAAGTPRDLSHLRASLFRAAGFVDIHIHEYLIPIGLRPKDAAPIRTLGKMGLVSLLEGLEAFCLRPLTATYGWMIGDVLHLCDQLRSELLTMEHRVTAHVKIVSGRKPVAP
ncbi:uncharacterized protein BO97DRAFT_436393 [Aspergillus homomorphus CBS 101889]|uniref:S-adenosyl-L-methionine-dependent methyltransferase n=1 Tax=Aspergillus homomorphus (strain CBS 101889) TaxID=1450537 RepID=A0A395HQ74_ASPHC|nr:hypothetical protein BO97DRAFT_436393 [Aspergillus homomorphus CBS 101889]RAL10102.1 hypothetical protein BO97DRAFT_436393 [Aspergillus homomorphus CBS 101889]